MKRRDRDGRSREGLPKIDINDEADLQELYRLFYPAGSGPLMIMRVVCSLIEAIAEEKGFNLKAPGDTE